MEVAGNNVVAVVEICDVAVFDGVVEEIGSFEVMVVVGTSTGMLMLAVVVISFERIAFEAVEAIDVSKTTRALKEMKVEVNRVS